ncbi:hypothetical protein Pla123a_33610 [Posidoniimonas polymericola]|uniref:Uncharacterized protein n=1 Tax=Posidoniimonas polymericola TaxID=2528002 RepID=A0A5C5YFQ2_9BACT|nr:hypothetical protein [Posidoniimonas polymericola]TWT74537.1 hypothetical protein Pla123a_33610 [Posidoniimonas polymericola]
MARLTKRYIRPIPLPKEQPPPEDNNEPGVRVIPSRLDVYSNVRQGPWTYLGSMLALSGGVYSVTLCTLLWLSSLRGPPLGAVGWQVLSELIPYLATMLPVFAVTAAYGGAISAVVLPVYVAAIKSMKLQCRWETHGALAGGVVALVAFLPLHFIRPLKEPQLDVLAIEILLGPLLATTFLQCGGAYAGLLNWRFAPPPNVGDAPGTMSLTFSIRQLLLLTLLTSLALGTLSYFRQLTLPLYALVGAWLVWQTISLPFAIWFGRWRRRVQSRRFGGRLKAMRQQR